MPQLFGGPDSPEAGCLGGIETTRHLVAYKTTLYIVAYKTTRHLVAYNTTRVRWLTGGGGGDIRMRTGSVAANPAVVKVA